MRPSNRQINFLEAIFGLVAMPSATARELFSKERPPFVGTLFLCLVLTIFVPIATQLWKLGLLAYRADMILSISIIVVFTFLVFNLNEALFLRLLGMEAEISHIMALVAYCLTPFMFLIWVCYFVNYFNHGSITLITFVLTGYGKLDHQLLSLIPIGALASQISALLICFYSLRTFSGVGALTALIVTLLSLIPLYASLIIGVAIAEFTVPGTMVILGQIAPWLAGILSFIGPATAAHG